MINLHNVDASSIVAGNQDFTFIGTGEFSATGQIRVAESSASNETIVELNTDGDPYWDVRTILNGIGKGIDANDFNL